MNTLSENVLDIDCAAEADKISEQFTRIVARILHRRGAVVAISGGIDSAVCVALAVRALGKKKVFGLLLPETDSSPRSTKLGMEIVQQLGIDYEKHDIAPTLDAIGCYKWRDAAIREVFPEYTNDWKNKIVISGGAKGAINFFKLVVQSPSGEIFEERLPYKQYLQIVAATNHKQRIRKTLEYFHADRLNYAVVGTPNRLEYDQGFFVKNGDGAADIKPIAHLYKTQVYKMAGYLGLPQDVQNAKPTTDTYSMEQDQDEFYFALPYHKMDLALWAYNHNIGADELAKFFGFTQDQASFIYKDIDTKRKTTTYQHASAILIENVSELPKIIN